MLYLKESLYSNLASGPSSFPFRNSGSYTASSCPVVFVFLMWNSSFHLNNFLGLSLSFMTQTLWRVPDSCLYRLALLARMLCKWYCILLVIKLSPMLSISLLSLMLNLTTVTGRIVFLPHSYVWPLTPNIWLYWKTGS